MSTEEQMYQVQPDYVEHSKYLYKAFCDGDKFCREWKNHWHSAISDEWIKCLNNHYDKHVKSIAEDAPLGRSFFRDLTNRLRILESSVIESESVHNMANKTRHLQSTDRMSYESVITPETEPNEVIRNLCEVINEQLQTTPNLSNKPICKNSRAIHVPIDYQYQKNEIVIIRPDNELRELNSWEPDPNVWPWVAEVLETNESDRELLVAWWGFTNDERHPGHYGKLVAEQPASQEELHNQFCPQNEDTILTDFCQWVPMDTIAIAGVKLIKTNKDWVRLSDFKKWVSFMRTDCNIGVNNDYYNYQKV